MKWPNIIKEITMKNKIILVVFMIFYSMNIYASNYFYDEGFRLNEILKYSSKGKKNMMCTLKGDC